MNLAKVTIRPMSGDDLARNLGLRDWVLPKRVDIWRWVRGETNENTR